MSLAVLGVVYWLVSPLWKVVEVQDDAPTSVSETLKDSVSKEKVPTLAQTKEMSGILVAQAHDASGNVRIIQNESGKILRFENFKTDNGPDLKVYLASDLAATDFIDLGALRGTQGNINYTLPENVDTNKYKYVLIWCRAFSILFSSAELQ